MFSTVDYTGQWYELACTNKYCGCDFRSLYYAIADGVIYIQESCYKDGNIHCTQHFRGIKINECGCMYKVCCCHRESYCHIVWTDYRNYSIMIIGDHHTATMSILSRRTTLSINELSYIKDMVLCLGHDPSLLILNPNMINM